MARLTSAEAYEVLSPVLSPRRWEVYEFLLAHPRRTARELEGEGFSSHDPSKRLCELRRQGLVYEVRVRPCSVTGRNVIEWDVTERREPVVVGQEERIGQRRSHLAARRERLVEKLRVLDLEIARAEELSGDLFS